MEKGYAAIIIQGSSGNGKAVDYNRRILKKHTLLASIKMPIDLFIGKSNVKPTSMFSASMSLIKLMTLLNSLIFLTTDTLGQTVKKPASILKTPATPKKGMRKLFNL